MLPNIPSVQKDAKKIMNAFKTAGKKIAEEEAEKAAAKAAAKKTKSKTIKKESVLFEFIVLLLKEQIILNKK
jgi:hypothetical protein